MLGVGAGQVPDEGLQLGVGLGAVHPVDPLGVLLRGEPALREGLAQNVRGAVAVGVGGTQIGLRRGLLGALLKVHRASVPKRDRSRLGGDGGN